MRLLFILLLLVALLAGGLYRVRSHGQSELLPGTTGAGAVQLAPAIREELLPDRRVLDVSVHTLEELRVLLDRAEQLSSRLRDQQRDASVVLVLHGPEVEFFSSKNYERYKEIVDQAARLDAFDIVDVKICQTMMNIRGVARDDIPAFIDQVPDGGVELERLRNEGYVYF